MPMPYIGRLLRTSMCTCPPTLPVSLVKGTVATKEAAATQRCTYVYERGRETRGLIEAYAATALWQVHRTTKAIISQIEASFFSDL